MIFQCYFLIKIAKKEVYLPQDCGADVAREADVAHRTRTDATRHARPRGKAYELHAAQRWRTGGAGGADTRHEATRVHADAREGRHMARGLACEGPTG